MIERFVTTTRFDEDMTLHCWQLEKKKKTPKKQGIVWKVS